MKVKLWETGLDTGAARQYSTLPKGDPKARKVWLPYSQITHTSREPEIPNNWTPCVVEVADWLVLKLDL